MGGLAGTDDNMGDSPGLELTGKIMVIAIIFLFFVIVVMCFLHLYAKWFWWSIERSSTTPHPHSGRRRRRRFVFTPGQDPAIYGVQRRGLDPEVLRSLPVSIYRPEDFKDGLECAVCLNELVHGEKARILPKCNHGFHVECVDMWFQSHSTCPLCRNLVASESSESIYSSGVRGDVSDNSSQSSSDSESSDAMSEADLESPNLPTNVLIWGNQTQVNSVGPGPSIQAPSYSSSSAAADNCSSSNNNHRRKGMLVIDIPKEMNPSSLPSTSRCAEDDLKSPMTSRLKSFTRMLSMKFSPRSPGSVDVEQAGRGQS